jgi:hypothetical protein
MEEGNRRFPSGMTNKGLGRLYTNCYFALGPASPLGLFVYF